MFFKTRTIDYYENVPPVGNWGSPVLTFVKTIECTIQPFTGDDGLYDFKDMENVRDLVITSLEVGKTLNKEKGFLYYDGVYNKIAYIMSHEMGVLPHSEVFTSNLIPTDE